MTAVRVTEQGAVHSSEFIVIECQTNEAAIVYVQWIPSILQGHPWNEDMCKPYLCELYELSKLINWHLTMFSSHQSSTHKKFHSWKRKKKMNSDLVELDIFLHSARPDGVEQSESTNSIHIGSVLAKVKGQLRGLK